MRNAYLSFMGAALAPLLMLPSSAGAQGTNADTFDISRFSDAGHDWFDTYYPEEGDFETLRQAIDSEKITPEHRVLVTETPDGLLALLTDQMAYHHIAEGTSANGEHWMATF
jgi:hypothetical protein